ncbi:MAG: hypothetical protein EBT02_06395 [Planctomycetia bacterium]|jgi:hypothetical protein|nr:hypothetical protein [Planctomycetia bacterium]
MHLADEQPENVCISCGEKWGTHHLKNTESHRIWIDQCDVCLKLRPVADVSEYGFLREGWDGEEVV